MSSERDETRLGFSIIKHTERACNVAGFWVWKKWRKTREKNWIDVDENKLKLTGRQKENFESESRGWFEKMILRLLCGSWSWDHPSPFIFPCLVCHCSFITSYMLFIWMCNWQCSCWENTTWSESGIGIYLRRWTWQRTPEKRWKFISLSVLSFLCKHLGSCTLSLSLIVL